MNIRHSCSSALGVVLAALLVTACGNSGPPPAATESGDATAQSWIGRKAGAAMAKAQHELETGNLGIGDKAGFSINGHGPSRVSHLPRAEISPQGDLLIAGEPVAITDGQRELLLDYRGQVIDLAKAGMAIGIQGADIAGTALGGIGTALFGGAGGRQAFEERIEAEAARIEGEAQKLCALLPSLYDSQQALAASLPEFQPYATMTPEDIDECGKSDDAGST